MKKVSSFTLLELIIAIAISSVIIIGMMQAVQNVQTMLSRSRALLNINKSICLAFNQIERDFNTAFIPNLSPKTESKQKDKTAKKESPSKKPAKTNQKDKESNFFIGEADLEESKKINAQRYHPFKKVSFVNSNPLQVWGEQRPRIVRVCYELIQNKEMSKGGTVVYDLYRKETLNIKTENFKSQDEIPTSAQEYHTIRKHIIAKNIKEMYLEYQMPKPKKIEKTKTETPTLTRIKPSEEDQIIKTFVWGTTKETKNIVPQKIYLYLTMWNDILSEEKTYICSIPIFSYPTVKTKKIKQQPKKEAPKKQPIKPRKR